MRPTDLFAKKWLMRSLAASVLALMVVMFTAPTLRSDRACRRAGNRRSRSRHICRRFGNGFRPGGTQLCHANMAQPW